MGLWALGCSESVVVCGNNAPETHLERLTQDAVERIDVLLVIDNSRSMADKQALLAQAIPG